MTLLFLRRFAIRRRMKMLRAIAVGFRPGRGIRWRGISINARAIATTFDHHRRRAQACRFVVRACSSFTQWRKCPRSLVAKRCNHDFTRSSAFWLAGISIAFVMNSNFVRNSCRARASFDLMASTVPPKCSAIVAMLRPSKYFAVNKAA